MLRCLLVEDNPHLPLLVRRYMDGLASVDAVTTAAHGLIMATDDTYDLFILDIQLGNGPTGVDVLHALRRDPRYVTTPMIAFTASVDADNQSRLRAAGFDGFLGKPFNRQDVRNIVERLAGVPAA
jgi:CheY-like chemotaxis protein